MTQLVAGEIVAQKGRETIFLAVGDGFVQVTGDRVAILIDKCSARTHSHPAQGQTPPPAVRVH